ARGVLARTPRRLGAAGAAPRGWPGGAVRRAWPAAEPLDRRRLQPPVSRPAGGGVPRHAALRPVLLPARPAARLEPAVRPARLLPVAMRGAADGGASGDPRTAGADRAQRRGVVPGGAEGVRRPAVAGAAVVPGAGNDPGARLPEPGCPHP